MTLLRDAIINALLVEPEQPPREVWVRNSRAGVLACVGGNAVAKCDLPDDAACLLYNAASPENGRRLNRAIPNKHGGTAFIISGPFLIAGRLYENRLCGLCPEQVEKYRSQFLVPHVFIRKNNEIVQWQRNG